MNSEKSIKAMNFIEELATFANDLNGHDVVLNVAFFFDSDVEQLDVTFEFECERATDQETRANEFIRATAAKYVDMSKQDDDLASDDASHVEAMFCYSELDIDGLTENDSIEKYRFSLTF